MMEPMDMGTYDAYDAFDTAAGDPQALDPIS